MLALYVAATASTPCLQTWVQPGSGFAVANASAFRGQQLGAQESIILPRLENVSAISFWVRPDELQDGRAERTNWDYYFDMDIDGIPIGSVRSA